MKKFILSMVALMIATISYAQNMLVATLTHGDKITMYYGNEALYQAHKAAQSGDVINLSGGSFASVKITKGITLRGTGIDDVSDNNEGNWLYNIFCGSIGCCFRLWCMGGLDGYRFG